MTATSSSSGKKLDFTVIIIIIINHNWKITKLILLKINVAWMSRLRGIQIFSVLLGRKVAYFISWQKTADFQTITLEKTVPEGYRRQQTYVIMLYPFLMGSEKSQKQKKVNIHYWESLGKICLAKQFCMKQVRKYLTAKNINSFHQYAIFWIHLSKWLLRTVSKFAVLYNFKGLWKHQLVKWMEVFFNK